MENPNNGSLISAFKLSKFHKIENIINSIYDFRRNEITGFVEFKKKESSEEEFRELPENEYYTIFCAIGKEDIYCPMQNFQAILKSNFIPTYNPFLNYFDKLKWDQKTDHILELANTVKTDNQEFWQACFKRWLVSSVACCTMGIPNHSVLVLSGAQGIGKTTWLNGLLPKSLSQYIFTGTIRSEGKDSLINMSETMFMNLDELENLNRNELNTLKSLITISSIRLRRPYGKLNVLLKRRTSFMGSINDMEFLTDVSGNRRYLCFTALEIDYSNKIDLELVYGQAYHLLKQGENGEPFKYWFDKSDNLTLEENNSKYRRISIEEELVLKYFKVPSNQDDLKYFTPTQIINLINGWEKSKILDQKNIRKLGQVMYAIGFKKKSLGSSKPYVLALTSFAESSA